jgi:hypothetical protein
LRAKPRPNAARQLINLMRDGDSRPTTVTAHEVDQRKADQSGGDKLEVSAPEARAEIIAVCNCGSGSGAGAIVEGEAENSQAELDGRQNERSI